MLESFGYLLAVFEQHDYYFIITQIQPINLLKNKQMLQINFDEIFNNNSQEHQQTKLKQTDVNSTNYNTNKIFMSMDIYDSFERDLPDNIEEQTFTADYLFQPSREDYRIYSNQLFPGQRLYFQHKKNATLKMRQQAILLNKKLQQQKHILKNHSFVNPNSTKILNRKKNHQPEGILPKQHQPIISSSQRSLFKELEKCTFQPYLISKSPKKQTSKLRSHSQSMSILRCSDSVFQKNYFQSKFRNIKQKFQQKLISEEAKKNVKTMGNQQFQQFIQKNDYYVQIRQKKAKVLRSVSKKYDLSTGQAYFQPKLNKKSTILNKNGGKMHSNRFKDYASFTHSTQWESNPIFQDHRQHQEY